MTLVKRSNIMFPSEPTFFDDFFLKELLGWQEPTKGNTTKLPPVNIQENDHSYQVDLAVPGFKKENFKIELENDVLTISAEVESKGAESGDKYLRKEISTVAFNRTFALPENRIDGEKVLATYNDGVLTVSLQKKEDAKPKPVRAITVG